METINERIKQVRFYYCEGNNVAFAQMLGKNPNQTSNWVREGYSVGRGIAAEIAETFGVDKKWLLTGEGSMSTQDGGVIQSIGNGSNNNTQVYGESLKKENEMLKEQVKELKEERDRLLSIIEKLTK